MATAESVLNVLNLKDCGRVAQVVEQCPFKAWVAGSNPAALTNLFNGLRASLVPSDIFRCRLLNRECLAFTLGIQCGNEKLNTSLPAATATYCTPSIA